ncbi:MAG: Lar family restriction alleviation protein [Lachnospiraceae bacterium]|nr:Lar family restriction alleviation protein [Lachnospiraceae bacterium]
MSKELKPCPFCGSAKLKIDKKSILYGYNGLDMRAERHTYSVRCNVCHARGGAIGGLVIVDRRATKVHEKFTTDDELKEKVISAWNRRANDGKTDLCG